MNGECEWREPQLKRLVARRFSFTDYSPVTIRYSLRKEMAERTGLEPATLGVTGRYSNQLNYRSALKPLLQGVVGAEGIEPPTFAL